jgi:phage gp37-like protein
VAKIKSVYDISSTLTDMKTIPGKKHFAKLVKELPAVYVVTLIKTHNLSLS